MQFRRFSCFHMFVKIFNFAEIIYDIQIHVLCLKKVTNDHVIFFGDFWIVIHRTYFWIFSFVSSILIELLRIEFETTTAILKNLLFREIKSSRSKICKFENINKSILTYSNHFKRIWRIFSIRKRFCSIFCWLWNMIVVKFAISLTTSSENNFVWSIDCEFFFQFRFVLFHVF